MPGQTPSDELLQQIFFLVARRTGCDFSLYKPSTLARRMDQRWRRVGCSDAGQYLLYLEAHPEEADKLRRQLLIGVTSFFRNPQSFERLLEAWKARWADRPPGPVRIWVAACSTGEEAYSLAMVFREFLDREAPQTELQVFATDIDPGAVDTARRGWYSDAAVETLDEDRRGRWMEREGRGWRVRKALRDHLTFAVHNLLSDPPFGQLDLVSCRNLLIYLDPGAQQQLTASFAFALRPDGLLLLGTSESVDPLRVWFEPLDKKKKLYRRQAGRLSRVPYPTLAPAFAEKKEPAPAPPLRDLSVKELVLDLLARDYAVPSVLVDSAGTIQFVWGDTSPIFRRRPGRSSELVVENVVDSLQVALANALGTAAAQRKTEAVEGLRLPDPDGRPIRLTVRPVEAPILGSTHYLVVFQILQVAAWASSSGSDPAMDRRAEDLERELNDTRLYLRNLVLKLESANEELAAGNEEAQSMNEELQSSNEELESSREELQATNDELENLNGAYAKRIEDLAHLNNDMSNMISSARLGIVFLDRDLKLQRFTPEAAAVLKLQLGDLGRSFASLAGPTLGRDLESLLGRVLKDLQPEEREISSGSLTLLVRVLPYRTLEDRIEGLVLTLNDLTALRKAEAEVVRTEQKFRALFEGNPSSVLLSELVRRPTGVADFRILAANPAFEKLVAIKAEHLEGKLGSEVLPFFGQPWLEAMGQVDDTGTPRMLSVVSDMLGRHLKIGLYTAGEARVAVLMEDVSEAMGYQEDLRRSEALFRSTLSSMDDLVSVLDREGRYLQFFQDHKRSDLFLKPEDFLGKRSGDLPLPREVIEAHARAFEAVRAGSVVAAWNFSLPFREGVRWYSARLSPRFTADGEFDGAVQVSRDVTDRVAAEEALAEREAQLRAVFEASPLGLFLVRDGVLVRANSALNRMYQETSLEGASVERLSNGEADPLGTRRDGSAFPLRIDLVDVEPGLRVGVAQDLSERQRMERSVLNSQRLESLGVLAGGIAHDFNNLLGGLFGFIQLARQASPEGSPAVRHLDRAFSAFTRAQDLTKQLLTFAKGGEPNKRILDLREPLLESAKFILSGANLRLEVKIDEDLWLCEVDRLQLGQVIDNLGLNARQALPGGGTVHLWASNVAPDKPRPTGLGPGPYVLIRFSDDGPGIAPEVLPKIFDPFFSTKKEGTGLGLATVYSILRKHGGLVEVESTLGRGTAFSLWFPALAPGADAHGISNRVLVLDDEELILDSVVESLVTWGYDAVGVRSGPTAVDAFRQSQREGNRFGFFLTDLTLPGEKGGLAVVEQLRRLDPGLKAAASSGYSDDPVMADPAAWGLLGFLAKPYTRDQLAAFMAKVYPLK